MYTCNKGSKYIPVTKVQVASNRPKRKKKIVVPMAITLLVEC